MMPKELCVQWWCTAPVSGGARRDWGAQLVAQMFSFLETVRLQGGEAIAQLYQLLCLAGRSPPGLQFYCTFC
jgi:hypothetical protein